MLLKFPALSAGIPDALLLILFSEELKLLFCDNSAYGSHGIQFPPTFSIEPSPTSGGKLLWMRDDGYLQTTKIRIILELYNLCPSCNLEKILTFRCFTIGINQINHGVPLQSSF